MRFVFLCAWSAVLTMGCSASHAPDHCDDPFQVDFDRRACADSVDQESDPADEADAGGRRPRRDGSVRDARVDTSFDPELEGDGPCKLGASRKCQCSSGAYSEQSCLPDRSWAVCACDGRPPLVFADAAVPRDASRPRGDASARDGGAADATVGRDANVDVLGPPLAYVPAAPTVPVPDCRAPAPVAPPARSARWLAYRAGERPGATATLQLVELAEAGPGSPVEAGPIDALGALGGWSSDGAQFAFTARASSRDAVASVQLAIVPAAGVGSPPTFVVAAPSSTFVSWAPGLLRLAARTAEASGPLLRALDTTAPVRELAALPLPATGLERAYWSPEGRYLGRSASDASGLSFWDLSVPAPTAIMVDSSGRALSWSPDGKRFLYLKSGSGTELWAVTFNGTVQAKQLVASNVYALGVRVSEPLWLDSDRIFWQEAGGELFISDLRAEPPVRSPLGLQPPYLSISPGGVCIAYSGPCATAGAQGVCVRKLDPAGAPVAAHVSNLPWGGVVWSQTGDQLALASPAGTVVEVLNLDGQAFAPQLLALGREGQLVRNNLAWAPGAPARWLAFLVPGDRRSQQTLSLWSVTSKKAFPVELGDQSAQTFAWSPDGRDLALQSFDPVGAPASPARLLVQRVAEAALGSQWTVSGPHLPDARLGGDLFVFQP